MFRFQKYNVNPVFIENLKSRLDCDGFYVVLEDSVVNKEVCASVAERLSSGALHSMNPPHPNWLSILPLTYFRCINCSTAARNLPSTCCSCAVNGNSQTIDPTITAAVKAFSHGYRTLANRAGKRCRRVDEPEFTSEAAKVKEAGKTTLELPRRTCQ
jgi:hypothetical protein